MGSRWRYAPKRRAIKVMSEQPQIEVKKRAQAGWSGRRRVLGMISDRRRATGAKGKARWW